MIDFFNSSFFQIEVHEISFLNWIWIGLVWAALSVVFLSVLSLLSRFFANRTQKTGYIFDEILYLIISKTHRYFSIPLALLLALYLNDAPERIVHPIKMIVSVFLFLQVGQWLSAIIRLGSQRVANRDVSGERISETTLNAIAFLAQLLLWTFIFLLALDNFGVNITALVTGLGIGGIAVALALQNILSDLFAYLSIAIDHPFAVGDFLILDAQTLGTVEKIGLKTTRLRSLSGEQIILSNSDLLNSRIRNYKRMNERRVVFSIGVVYQTPKDKLEKIPGILKEIVLSQDLVRFDRAHFQRFGDFSLTFEVVYYVLAPDFNTYMDRQQAINFAIFERFAQEGIEFAYPTQTLFLERTAKD